PPRGKLDLPGKLALALCNVSLALVPTALDIGFAYRAARTHVLNFLFHRQIFLSNRRVKPAAILAHRKIRQHFHVLVLPHKLGYLLTQLAAALQYGINLLNQNSLPVRFPSALEAIFDPYLVKTIQKKAAHVRAVGGMTAAKWVWNA